MTTLSFRSRYSAWILSAVAAAVVIGLLFTFNPLNTSTTQWIGPAKTASSAGDTR
jgi:hypothetical protein